MKIKAKDTMVDLTKNLLNSEELELTDQWELYGPYLGRLQKCQYCAAIPIKRCSLCLCSQLLEWPLSCPGQQNMVDVILSKFRNGTELDSDVWHFPSPSWKLELLCAQAMASLLDDERPEVQQPHPLTSSFTLANCQPSSRSRDF